MCRDKLSEKNNLIEKKAITHARKVKIVIAEGNFEFSYDWPIKCVNSSLTLVPPEMCLLGCVFYITDYVKIVGQSEIDKWKKVTPDTSSDIGSFIRI